jgi:hypothetical protein
MRKQHGGLPFGFKILGGVIALLVLAYGVQLMFTSPTTAAPTALVVADAPADYAVKEAPSMPIEPIRIISPANGSIQSPGFSVKIAIGSSTVVCYYRTDDNNKLTWDRRMKPCTLDLTISKDFCKAKGANTCKVYVEATDANGNVLGSDTAYFSLQ